MAKTITKKDIMNYCAGHFLSDELPDNWEDMGDDEFYEFLESNAWEPHEGSDGGWIWEQIESSAYSMEQFLKKYEIDITE